MVDSSPFDLLIVIHPIWCHLFFHKPRITIGDGRWYSKPDPNLFFYQQDKLLVDLGGFPSHEASPFRRFGCFFCASIKMETYEKNIEHLGVSSPSWGVAPVVIHLRLGLSMKSPDELETSVFNHRVMGWFSRSVDDDINRLQFGGHRLL